MMKRVLPVVLLLTLSACAAAPREWRVNGPAPEGWREVMAEAARQVSCHPSPWGGVIDVLPAPFMCGGQMVWGCSMDRDYVKIVYSARAVDGALPEEACHSAIYICDKSFFEEPARACKARVIEALQ